MGNVCLTFARAVNSCCQIVKSAEFRCKTWVRVRGGLFVVRPVTQLGVGRLQAEI